VNVGMVGYEFVFLCVVGCWSFFWMGDDSGRVWIVVEELCCVLVVWIVWLVVDELHDLYIMCCMVFVDLVVV
jgi:hypothetical protein